MIKSLYSGVTGLKSHQQRMDVIGNNIANVNTTGFKASRVTFQDIYYQTKQYGSAGSAGQGGQNYTQIGYGANVATIDTIMTRSGFNSTDSSFDLAIAGEGFFQVMDSFGNIFYTRAGYFSLDSDNNLVDKNGNFVLGVNGDSYGVNASSTPLQIKIPSTVDSKASYTKMVDGVNFQIQASVYGENGNLSISFQDGSYPYATLSGSALTITLDRTRQITSLADLQTYVDDAVRAGGVSLPNGLTLNLSVDPEPTLENAQPTPAANESKWSYTYQVKQDDGTTSAKTVSFNIGFMAGTAYDPANPNVTAKGGADANAYTIQYKYSTSTNTSASWDGNALTVNFGKDALESTDIGAIQTLVQDAIKKAAGLDELKGLNITSFTMQDTTDPENPADITFGDLFVYDPSDPTNIVGSKEDRDGILGAIDNSGSVKLMGGKDAFYTTVLKGLTSCNLTNGRIGSEQKFSELTSFAVQSDGTLVGIHPVHGTLQLGRIDIVTFENPEGLEQLGNSYFGASQSSGAAKVTIPGENASGELVSGALEMSNVDLSQEFSDMIITQRGFQANSRIITTSDEILQELINLKR